MPFCSDKRTFIPNGLHRGTFAVSSSLFLFYPSVLMGSRFENRHGDHVPRALNLCLLVVALGLNSHHTPPNSTGPSFLSLPDRTVVQEKCPRNEFEKRIKVPMNRKLGTPGLYRKYPRTRPSFSISRKVSGARVFAEISAALRGQRSLADRYKISCFSSSQLSTGAFRPEGKRQKVTKSPPPSRRFADVHRVFFFDAIPPVQLLVPSHINAHSPKRMIKSRKLGRRFCLYGDVILPCVASEGPNPSYGGQRSSPQ